MVADDKLRNRAICTLKAEHKLPKRGVTGGGLKGGTHAICSTHITVAPLNTLTEGIALGHLCWSRRWARLLVLLLVEHGHGTEHRKAQDFKHTTRRVVRHHGSAVAIDTNEGGTLSAVRHLSEEGAARLLERVAEINGPVKVG